MEFTEHHGKESYFEDYFEVLMVVSDETAWCTAKMYTVQCTKSCLFSYVKVVQRLRTHFIILSIVLLLIVQACRNWVFVNPDAHQYH